MSINATDTGTNNASTAGPDTSTNNAATTGPVVMSSVAPVQLPAQTGTRNATTQLIGTSVPSPTVSIPDAADAGISSTQRALVRTCLAVVDEHRKGNITHTQATIQIFGILPDDKFGIEAFTSYVEQLSQTDPSGETVGLKRSADQMFGSGDEIGTRALPDESMYPWSDIPVSSTSLDPDIALTLALRANYLIDVRRAKHTLIIRADCPTFPEALWTDILLDKY